MAQVGHFQVKAMFFQVTKHFFNPHPQAIQANSGLRADQVSCQEPGFGLAALPMQDQMGRERASTGQEDMAQPQTHTGCEQHAIDTLPDGQATWQYEMVTALPQGIVAAPVPQTFTQQGMVKFTITGQRHLYPAWQQSVNVLK